MYLKLKHMEMYFMDNDAEGVRVAWFPSHVLKAYIVPRTKLKGAKQLIEHDQLEHILMRFGLRLGQYWHRLLQKQKF